MTQDKAQAAGAVSTVQKLRLIAEDPMWADHVEMHKLFVTRVANELEAAEASLARLVEGVVALRKRSLLIPGMHNSVIEGMSALLPAKAEAPTLICQRCDTDRLKAPCPISGDLCSVARADAHLLATPAPAMGEYCAETPEQLAAILDRIVKEQAVGKELPKSLAEVFMENEREDTKRMAHTLKTEPSDEAKEFYAAITPRSDEDTQIIATFEQHIDKDLDTSPGVTSYWIKQSEVVEAVRACMALRQPGAASGDEREALADLRKAVQDGVSDEWLLGFVRQRPLTPAAPVSQPAAQEPVAYCVPNAKGKPEFGKGWMFSPVPQLKAQMPLYTAPTPLSAPAGSEQDIAAMANRFLGWPLPKTFGPDCGISFDGRKDDEWNKNKAWPVGTNLFTADEAKAMFLHCLGGAK